MPIELRPNWCLGDETIDSVLEFGAWSAPDGRPALDNDGDDWQPGEHIVLKREIRVRVNSFDLRRAFGLTAGESIGVAARWSCRATATAGTHVGGPAPLRLSQDLSLDLEVPSDIAGSLELETCLVVTWTSGERPADAAPDGALVWSDGWSTPIGERTLLLEGGEARVPVRTVSFNLHFGQPSGALWAIDVDTTIEPDDLLANVVTVLLNKDVLGRDFRGVDGEPDAARLPDSALAGISVDLVRSLTGAMREELTEGASWAELPDGSVGSMLLRRLTEAFGSITGALDAHEKDEPTFSRQLWNRFAPDSWSSKK
ncbi:MAG: hypothetical protein ABMA25_00405 [Ilumatobacteraceae bacterium]